MSEQKLLMINEKFYFLVNLKFDIKIYSIVNISLSLYLVLPTLFFLPSISKKEMAAFL